MRTVKGEVAGVKVNIKMDDLKAFSVQFLYTSLVETISNICSVAKKTNFLLQL